MSLAGRRVPPPPLPTAFVPPNNRPTPTRTHWELPGEECTSCLTDGSAEWTCPALIRVYNDLLADSGGREAEVVEIDFGEGEKRNAGLALEIPPSSQGTAVAVLWVDNVL